MVLLKPATIEQKGLDAKTQLFMQSRGMPGRPTRHMPLE